MSSERKTSRKRPAPKREIVRTWAFDSQGDRKYAVQIQKASNGNPCLKIVEGVPQEDGTFRKFNLTIWSEDFDRLWSTLDEVRAFMTEHDIRTPEGHKYVPGGKKKGTKARRH
ncbi:MAG: hypothetical protein SYC29_01230 [Planctomycetota bacterium]|nr:hypothetical protein [Planctomycetota bacterium]